MSVDNAIKRAQAEARAPYVAKIKDLETVLSTERAKVVHLFQALSGIQGALNTEEAGENLVAVAKAAHKAEQSLAGVAAICGEYLEGALTADEFTSKVCLLVVGSSTNPDGIETQHLLVMPINGKFGIKAKNFRWFHWYYDTEAQAYEVAQKLEEGYDHQIEQVNFGYPAPAAPARNATARQA